MAPAPPWYVEYRSHTTPSETPKAASITPDAIAPDTPRDSLRPKKALIRKPRNGSAGISSSTRSPLQRGVGIGTERLPVPEQGNHEREADGRFGRGNGHDEERD